MGASWLLARLVLFLVSPRLQEESDRGKMVLITVEAVPAGSKLPAAVRVRISTGEKHGFGAAAPLSTRASSLVQGRAGGLVESSPKLVRHIGLVSTCAKSYPHLPLDLLQRPPYACEFWCLVVRLPPWQDVAADRLA